MADRNRTLSAYDVPQSITANGKSVDLAGSHKDTAAIKTNGAKHFEVVANESAAGLSSVQLEFGIPIGNGILTCDTEEQARARMDTKGYEAAQAALELANLLDAIDED